MWHWQKKQKLKFFISRRSTFKYKLLLRGTSTRTSEFNLRVPTKYANIAESKLANESAGTDDLLTMPTYEQHEDIFSFSGSCCIIETTREAGLKGLSVSEQDAIDCLLDSLFVFLRLLLGGKNFYVEKPLKEQEAELGAECFHGLKKSSMG